MRWQSYRYRYSGDSPSFRSCPDQWLICWFMRSTPALSFFTHYLTSHSRTTCPQIYVYHTRPRRPPQHIDNKRRGLVRA